MKAVEGWIPKQFDEIGTIFSGSTPSTSVHTFWGGEIVWVTPNDLSKLNTPYLSESDKRITSKGLDGCSTHLLPAGSIIISSRAPIGYVAISTVEFCTNQGCKSIQLKDSFNPEFTYCHHRLESLPFTSGKK
ncbi:MAG: restriction endonuclease subunit S [Deltaproteobacteria bacterium]|nr:restriction endonuclease subunit S [Deltaproteobacteria bacterium]